MKDNFVILYEIAYDSKDGYEVAINTHLGVFTGYTEADEVDKKYPSSYHASEIALAKALRKFAKAAVKQLNREFNLISNMITQACDAADGPEDIDNNAFRILNGTLKQKKKEIEKWQARADAQTKKIITRIAARDRIVANYQTKEKEKGQN